MQARTAAKLVYLLSLLTTLGAAASGQAPDVEDRTLAAVNAVRERHGLEPLEPMPALKDLARRHSRRMATQDFLAHDEPGGRTFIERIRSADLAFRRVGENIAMNSGAADPASTAVRGWLASEQHRANMLDPAFTHTGMGAWSAAGKFYFTQIFLTPPDQSSAAGGP